MQVSVSILATEGDAVMSFNEYADAVREALGLTPDDPVSVSVSMAPPLVPPPLSSDA